MSVCRKASRPLASLLQPLLQPLTLIPVFNRPYTSAASTAQISPSQESEEETVLINISKAASQSPYRVSSSVVLSRPPILTRDLTKFEASYYFYQRRLNDRLALPFTRYFYFKKGTLAAEEYKRKQAKVDRYNPYGPRGWADELLVGDDRHLQPDNGYQFLVDSTITGEESGDGDGDSGSGSGGEEGSGDGEVKRVLTKPLSRITKADKEGDLKSLDRALTRTLYLVVRKKRERHAWKFPQSDLVETENLHEAAERTLKETAGINMNTWFVGHVPIGHHIYTYLPGYSDDDKNIGKKVFFMKARIMAGQADLSENVHELDDFKWLTKEEISEVTERAYFNAIKHMLVAR